MILNDTTGTASTNPQGLIQKAWRAYKGNTNWPASGTSKYLQMVMTANDLKNIWATDAKVHWDSLFSQNNNIGTVASPTLSYNLPASVFYLSDYVYVLLNDGSGNTQRFKVVHPESRNDDANGIGINGADFGDPTCYLTGSYKGGSGQMAINFVTPWSQMSAALIGGTIQAGTYVLPADMVNNSDIVPVNNPEWLVYALAAELARNDPAKEDQFETLNGIANDIYKKMVLDNQGNSFQQPNGPAYMGMNPGITWQQV